MPERDCLKCTAARKVQWGCQGNATSPLVLDGKNVDTCPRRPLLDEPGFYRELFFLYRAYQKGFLPEPGGLNDQPAYLISCFQVIDAAIAEVEREQDRKRKLDAERKARGTTSKR